MAAAFSGADRGQTLHDYALGVGVFVVAVGVVFSFVPTILSPFSAPIETSQSVQVERAAAGILDRVTAPDAEVALDADRAEGFFDGAGGDDLRDVLGLQSNTRVNATVVGDGGVVTSGGVRLAAGDVYRDQPAVTSVRVVGAHPDCDPTCRLVVRVW